MTFLVFFSFRFDGFVLGKFLLCEFLKHVSFLKRGEGIVGY